MPYFGGGRIARLSRRPVSRAVCRTERTGAKVSRYVHQEQLSNESKRGIPRRKGTKCSQIDVDVDVERCDTQRQVWRKMEDTLTHTEVPDLVNWHGRPFLSLSVVDTHKWLLCGYNVFFCSQVLGMSVESASPFAAKCRVESTFGFVGSNRARLCKADRRGIGKARRVKPVKGMPY